MTRNGNRIALLNFSIHHTKYTISLIIITQAKESTKFSAFQDLDASFNEQKQNVERKKTLYEMRRKTHAIFVHF